MISTNIATIAASLPLLNPLVKDLKISTIFEKTLSFLSLRSLISRGSDAPKVSGRDGRPASGIYYYYYRGDDSSVDGGRPDSIQRQEQPIMSNTYHMNDLRFQEGDYAS